MTSANVYRNDVWCDVITHRLRCMNITLKEIDKSDIKIQRKEGRFVFLFFPRRMLADTLSNRIDFTYCERAIADQLDRMPLDQCSAAEAKVIEAFMSLVIRLQNTNGD